MRVLETPQTHPYLKFETRWFDCEDGIARVATLPDFYWRHLDKYIYISGMPLRKIIGICVEVANNSELQDGHGFLRGINHIIMLSYSVMMQGKSPASLAFNNAAGIAPHFQEDV